MSKIWRKIRRCYWKVWPFYLRPGEIWYSLKCNVWHRYTTVKPRTMPWNSWVDKVDLVPHVLFEMLCSFWEDEVLKGRTDFIESGHTIKIDGKDVNVYHVWENAYEWWNNVYLKEIDRTNEEWYTFHKSHNKSSFNPIPGTELSRWDSEYDSEENEKECSRLLKEARSRQTKLEEELIEHMVNIVKTHQSMWT